MNFGKALEEIKRGKKVFRKNWNGKRMYIFIINGCEWDFQFHSELWGMRKSPFIAMKTADNCIVPWLASQTDILAEDWETMAK